MSSSYRVEVSPNNRAGCQDKVCKDAKTKIMKGELRFGVWVVMPGTDHGSWRWRHWGCVSGKTVTNVQESLEKDDSYDWDMLDGFDEISDADIRAKIQRVVTQGHIDAEDFNGDPEFNQPGKTAIRGRAKKAKAGEDEDDEDAVTPKKAAPKKAAGAKRGRKKADDEDEDEAEEAEPVKKKAKVVRKSKKAEIEDDEEEVQPVKKARAGRKAKKNDDSDENEAAQPVKKTKGGRKAKPPVDEAEDEDVKESKEPKESKKSKEPAPAKKGRAKKVVKKEPSPPPADEEEAGEAEVEEEEEKPVVKPTAKGKAGRKTKAAPQANKRRASKAKAEDDD